MGEENKTRDAVDAVTGLVKAVPVYEDVIQPTAKEVGVTLQKTVHMALSPISAMVWGYDKIEEFVKISVAKRLEKIPPEQIRTPLPQIAGPALEALKYTGHDENLREMFSKLLATAMDEKTAATAHPSFVEIIRQLSPDEAKICRLIKHQTDFPIINLYEKVDENNQRSYLTNFSVLGYEAACEIPKLIQRYLDNLHRLGLIKIQFDKWLTDETNYTKLETHPDFIDLIKQMKTSDLKSKTEKGVIQRTNFGGQFFDACID
jgi:hypothetical protein